MQDDPLEDVIEDDDFLSDENVVTTPAPGKKLGTFVEASSNSGIFPNKNRSYTGQRFSAFTTFSLFACLIVMVISAIFLICMFFGYV